jgi:hypothetical protein
VQLELVADLDAFLQNELILGGVTGPERLGIDLFRREAEEFFAALERAPFEERVVDAGVATLEILDEEDDVGKLVEQLLEERETDLS